MSDANPVAQADQCGADLVHALAELNILSCMVRLEGGEVRVIAPANNYARLAIMLYRAADEMAGRAPKHNLHMRD